MPDIAGAWGVRPAVGPGVWGCTVSEGRAAVVSIGAAVCACVGDLSGGVYAGSAAGRSGVPWCGWCSGWPVLLPLGWLPAVDRAQARRVVLGVAGFLWGSGPVPCAYVRCRGVAQAGRPPPPFLRGWVLLSSRQVMPVAPGSLWPGGVVLVVVTLPVWTHALVGGFVAFQPEMVPDRP